MKNVTTEIQYHIKRLKLTIISILVQTCQSIKSLICFISVLLIIFIMCLYLPFYCEVLSRLFCKCAILTDFTYTVFTAVNLSFLQKSKGEMQLKCLTSYFRYIRYKFIVISNQLNRQ